MTKSMDKNDLIRQWIQYLKNSQIVDQASSPRAGKLTYKRKVTSDDLMRFFEVKFPEIDQATVQAAIDSVVAKRPVRKPPPRPTASAPAAQPQAPANPTAVPPVTEAIRDKQETFSEKEIEEIFDILVAGAGAAATSPSPATPDPAQAAQQKIKDLNKLKLMIRDQLSDAQRKALWRALNEV